MNDREPRAGLEARGHRIKTGSDREAILHLYEERGEDCVHALNGQFAFGLRDPRRNQRTLARDRPGVRPLFFVGRGDRLFFGSEITALLAHPGIRRDVDLVALGQVFHSWAPLPPRTMFQGISAPRPGHVLVATARATTVHSMPFSSPIAGENASRRPLLATNGEEIWEEST